MNIEHSLDRYRFTCRTCAHTWTADYRVDSVTDGDGTAWSVHYRYGTTCENPAGDVIVCPGCHHTTVDAHLVTHRDLPDADRIPAPGPRTAEGTR